MVSSSWAARLTAAFPNLADAGFEIVGEPSERYNCIAYAAGDTSRWWWPDGVSYWPPWASRSESIASLKEVFAGQGYEVCDDSNAAAGYQKVALYEWDGKMQHAALQLPNGRWRSKMGQGPVIEHDNPDALSGGMYGQSTIVMRRARV